MKDFKRTDRIASLLQQALSETLIRKVRDPRIQKAMVTGVKVTADMGLARVYVRTLDPDRSADDLLEGFRACEGFFKREIGKHVHLLRIPRLEFFYDELPDQAAAVEALLDKMRREE
ncbi:MAG: 30S ribosome-binding factor RbfA [Deltaproteobacteria bacterium]|nr:30S ribosome-binding factor RbfA [Deltaproteobacteria bacterium]